MEQIFWYHLFPLLTLLLGSFLTIVANYWKEKSNRNTQITLEKVKMYDELKFKAYIELYEFISKAYFFYWPPDNPRRDFIIFMKDSYFNKVKVNYPFYKKEIRAKVRLLENQYECLLEPDFIPNIPFNEFFHEEYLKILNELNQSVENIFDKWEKK